MPALKQKESTSWRCIVHQSVKGESGASYSAFGDTLTLP
jgi:hypothetical protein